jgi:TRAP-type C4-dicarboxylate transport system permease small subunit
MLAPTALAMHDLAPMALRPAYRHALNALAYLAIAAWFVTMLWQTWKWWTAPIMGRAETLAAFRCIAILTGTLLAPAICVRLFVSPPPSKKNQRGMEVVFRDPQK